MAAYMLEAISTRFSDYSEGGRQDDSLILSEDASKEARLLWRFEADSEGNISIKARQALAWFHFARYDALPEGDDLNDLQAALVFFTPIFLMAPDEVPEQVKEFLEHGDAATIIDNDRVAARWEHSYTARTYPNSVAYIMELKRKVTHVPMPSNEKPDINGFREGDRVRLTAAFAGERNQYAVGSTGTLMVTNTSPASIELSRDTGLVHVYIDRGKLIMIKTDDLEKIPGKATVTYSPDQESFSSSSHNSLDEGQSNVSVKSSKK